METYNKLLNPDTMSKVNLDALIPRADFIDSTNTISQSSTQQLTLAHLVKDNITSIYSILRKPIFRGKPMSGIKVKYAI